MLSDDLVTIPAHGVDWLHRAWRAVLVVAVSGFSLVSARAAPSPRFGALAALTHSRRDALGATFALWLINQVIGFAVLGYPQTANSVVWGLAIGIAAVLGTLAAQWTVRRLTTQSLARAVAAFAAAFA